MKLTAEGLELIKRFEGCRLEAYRDIVGVLTIGYGDTENVVPGMTITQQEADDRLDKRLEEFQLGILPLVPAVMTDNQFSACVSLSYNIGLEAFKKSLLLRCCQKYNFEDAAKQFEKWNHAGGRVISSLTKRREAERNLFLS